MFQAIEHYATSLATVYPDYFGLRSTSVLPATISLNVIRVLSKILLHLENPILCSGEDLMVTL